MDRSPLAGAGGVFDLDINAECPHFVEHDSSSGCVELYHNNATGIQTGTALPFKGRRSGVSARALRGQFPDIPLVPTGGVTLANLAELFQAGAAAVGVGTELIAKDALARRDFAAIGALAKHFLAAVRQARGV
jgi:2-keto-3-deoxy-6-phosphogluconate aldolase